MPTLRTELARREGCQTGIDGSVYDQCKVRYVLSEEEFSGLMGGRP